MKRRTVQSLEELRVRKIRNGTVIDHLPQHSSLIILKILGITGKTGNIVSVAINVPSEKLGKKDIIKIEDREFNTQELDKIALIAPKATVNIVRDFEVVEKRRVKLPEIIIGIVKCANITCISNSKEPTKSTFYVRQKEPLRIMCHYCGHLMEREEMLRQL